MEERERIMWKTPLPKAMDVWPKSKARLIPSLENRRRGARRRTPEPCA